MLRGEVPQQGGRDRASENTGWAQSGQVLVGTLCLPLLYQVSHLWNEEEPGDGLSDFSRP